MKSGMFKPDLNSWFLAVTLVVISLFITQVGGADPVKTIHLSDETVALVRVSIRGTVLSFPVKPSKVILGRAGSFGIEYVENDLAISPLGSTARSNLFVYLYGRRFAFDLIASLSEGSALILVRDALDPSVPKPTPPPKRRKK